MTMTQAPKGSQVRKFSGISIGPHAAALGDADEFGLPHAGRIGQLQPGQGPAHRRVALALGLALQRPAAQLKGSHFGRLFQPDLHSLLAGHVLPRTNIVTGDFRDGHRGRYVPLDQHQLLAALLSLERGSQVGPAWVKGPQQLLFK